MWLEHLLSGDLVGWFAIRFNCSMLLKRDLSVEAESSSEDKRLKTKRSGLVAQVVRALH